ncbi:MAG: MFS transporter [Caldilineaceae bacterium]|nr:MFS transporter [Caldilineaceae bacterium]
MKALLTRNPIILPVYAPTMLLAIGSGLLTPILPLYATSFGASYALVGIVLGSRGLGTIIGDLPAGILLRRLGQRRLMMIGLACIALCGFAMSTAQALWMLILYGLIEGIGGALWNISRHAYLTDAAPVGQRGRAIATFGGIFRTGNLVGQAIGGLLAAWLGLRAPFAVYAVIALVTLLFPAFFGTEDERHQAHKAGHHHHVNLWHVVRDNYNVLLSAGVGQLFAQMIRSGRNIVVPLYGADVLGLSIPSVGLVMSISSAIDALMFFPAGHIMDRFGRKYAYVSCFLIQGVGMALIPFTNNFLWLVVATGLIGFGNGLGSGTMMTLGADLAPKDAMGEFLGIWRLIGDGGALGGPLLVGSLADLLSLTPAIFAIAIIGMMAASILGFFVPETLQRPSTVPS